MLIPRAFEKQKFISPSVNAIEKMSIRKRLLLDIIG